MKTETKSYIYSSEMPPKSLHIQYVHQVLTLSPNTENVKHKRQIKIDHIWAQPFSPFSKCRKSLNLSKKLELDFSQPP